MAILSSPLNFQRISKTADEVRQNVGSAGRAVKKIGEVVFYRTKMKRNAFATSKMIRNRRVENERRSQIEDEVEAPNVVVKPDGPQRLVQADTSKGFFDRILGFVGYLTAGWIMNSLPTLIGMGKEFIARIQKATQILSGFFNNTVQLFLDFGNILGSLGQNIMRFDFFDSSNRLKNSFADLNLTLDNMGKQLEEALGLVTTPLTEGKYSGEEIPGFGTQYQSEGAYETQTPSGGTSGGGRWKPLLDVIASGEGGYESVNPGQVVPGLTEMTIAEAWATAQRVGRSKRGSGAMGRYQLLSDPIGRAKKAGLNPYKDKFSPENQDRIAIYIIENIRNGNRWLSGNLPGGDASFAQGIANEWAGVPNLYGQYTHSGQGGKVKASSVKNALSRIKKNSSIPSSQSQVEQVPPGKVKPIVTSRYGALRGKRMHGGTDLSVKEGTPLRAISDGVIVDSDYERGWGNFLVMKDNLGIYHLYGHMQSGYKRGGPVKKGEVIGRVGMTGRTTGPHLHWESGTGWTGYQIIGKFDPLNRYSKFAPFNTPPGPGVAPGTPAEISAPSQQKASVPPSLTPERRGQDIIIAQPPSQQNVIVNDGSDSMDMGVTPASNFDMLNNFIKKKLLLDLAYL